MQSWRVTQLALLGIFTTEGFGVMHHEEHDILQGHSINITLEPANYVFHTCKLIESCITIWLKIYQQHYIFNLELNN